MDGRVVSAEDRDCRGRGNDNRRPWSSEVTTRHSLVQTLVAGTLAVLLAGCSAAQTGEEEATSLPGPTPFVVSPSESPGGPGGGRPQVGDCWFEKHYEETHDWQFWEGKDAVDCATKHNAITYRVRDLPPAFDASPSPEREDGNLPPIYVRAIKSICDTTSLRRYSGADLSRVTAYWYLPSQEQWSHGARWIRCDLTVHRLGSRLSADSLELLPATLEQVDERPEADYALCTRGVDPTAAYAVVVSCASDSAEWRFYALYAYPDEPTLPFPGTAAIEERGKSLCGYTNPGVMVNISQPTEHGWPSGYRTIYCFVAM